MLRFAFFIALAVLTCLESGAACAQPPVAWARVTFDRKGVTSTQAAGPADIATARALGVDDPVRIASISKLVTAIAVMRLVEAHRLDLDADVSTLLGWRLRNPTYPAVPITLRLLLSHRASLTDAAGYYGIALGESMQPLFDDPRAWDAAHAPGTYFRYANIDLPVIAAVMERATGERFDRIVDAQVLRPLHIDGCFNWELCSAATVARAVVLYDDARQPVRDDLHGARPSCSVEPSKDGRCDLSRWSAGSNGTLFSPQGGLRLSARGLAQVGRLLLGGGRVDGVRLLSRRSLRTLVGPAWTSAPGNGMTYEGDETSAIAQGFFCRYGLGVQTLATTRAGCRDDPFGDGIPRIGHAGAAYGLVSGIWVDTRAGRGVAYFATGVRQPDVGAHSAFTPAEEKLAAPAR